MSAFAATTVSIMSRNLLHICTGDGSHNDRTDTSSFYAADFFKGTVKRTWLTEPVVSFSHAVKGELIFLTAVGF